MGCEGCGADNREDASFCSSCGAPLARHCAGCARPLASDARFCDGCGLPQATPPPAAAVRKTVTAVFCDLGGSTGFGERVDAETARRVIGRYHALLQEVVDEHAGTVAKFIGDGMLAFFGIPEVAEDDAERAVAAAAEMQRRVTRFAEEVAAGHGERLSFRVGVNSGEVVIGEGDADVVGDALNVAARLEKACAPGRVLVGEATWRLTRSRFGFDPVGEVEVSGRAEPVAAYVLAEDERPTDEATPFVGRDDELRRLRGALDDAVAARGARLVTIIGPPGVGKTRLARELEASVAAGARVLHTACERAGGSTFGPLVDLIRPAIGDEATKESLAAIVPAAEPERERVVDGLAGVVGLGEARSTEETFWALRRLVESLAADQPLVLVIDDIQWAEARLLDLLEHLAEWVADAPVLLVGLARPELREVRPALAEAGRRMADVLVLDGLDPASTAQLAGEMLGGHGLPAELVARLPASTDGNPLFVRELVRMLVDEGIIRRDGDDWRLTVDADAIEVPPTIRSLLAARIERLPALERTVLERASVVGPDFAVGAVRALMEDVAALDGRLEGLRRRDLLEPTGTYWGEEPVWRFHHVLIRDAVYGRLLKEDRADLHERVGDWTAGVAPSVVGEHETAIAHHYEQAHAYRSQLGGLDDHGRELGRRAAGLLAVAVRRSLAQDDLVAAATTATRALACLDDGADDRGELLLLAAEAILASGDLGRAPTVLDDLAALGATDPGLAAWADVYRAQWLDLTDPTRLDEVERLADHATERFTRLGDGSGQAKAHLVRASLLARRGRLADSEVELDRAMVAAREAHDRRRLVAALGAAPAVALWGPSPVARAGGRCLDVIRLLRITTRSPVVEATSLRHQAVLEALRGRFGPARTLLTDVRSTVEDLGLRRDLMEVELFEGIVDLLEGDAAAAEGHLRAAYDGLAALGASAAGGAAAVLARAVLAQGRVEDAAALTEVAGSTSGQDLKAAIAWASVTAEIRAVRGDAGAVAAAEQAVALAEGTDLVLDHADALAALARVRRITGDPAGAGSAAAEAHRRYEAKGSTVHGGEPAVPSARATASSGTGTTPRHRVPPPENLAARLTRELTDRWLAEGPDAALDGYAADYRLVDQRRGLGSELVGREGIRAQLQAILDLIGEDGRLVLREVVAQRGEHLVLFRQAVEADGYEVEMLSLVEVDADGRQVASTIYDLDQRPAAMAALDDRDRALTVAEATALVGNRAARLNVVLIDRFVAEGADAVVDLIAEDVHVEDRRVGLQAVTDGREAHLANLVGTDGLWGESQFATPEAIAGRGAHLVLSRQFIVGDAEVEMLTVTEFDAMDRMALLLIFDPDDVEGALAELDRRHAVRSTSGPTRVGNRAARLNLVLIDRWMDEGADGVADLIAEGIVVEDRRTGLGAVTRGREAHLANMRAVDELRGESRFVQGEVVVTRGERLVLARQGVAGDAEIELLTLAEFDAEDRLCAAIHFDPDDLAGAVQALDRRYATTEGEALAAEITITAVGGQAIAGGDADAFAALVTDDFVCVDHRPVGWGERDRETTLAAVAARPDTLGRGVWIGREMRPRPGRVLTTYEIRTDADIVEAGISVTTLRGDRCDRLEVFAEGDRARAEARFAELAPAGPEVANAATRAMAPYPERFARREWAWTREFCAEHHRNDDRRSGVNSGVSVGRDRLLELTVALADAGFTTLRQDTVAVRGDELALYLRTWGHQDGFELTLLALVEVDAAGQFVANTMWDPEDRALALDELDLRHRELEGAAHPTVLRVMHAFSQAFARRDWEAIPVLVSPSFRAVDHRPLGHGEIGFAERFERDRGLAEAVPDALTYVAAAQCSTRVGLLRGGWTSVTPDGPGFESLSLIVLVVDDDGLMVRLELFAEDDADRARASFDEQVAVHG